MVSPHLCMSRLQIKLFIQGHIQFLKILLSRSSLSKYLPLLDFFCPLKFLIIVCTMWLASWCHTGANQESILQLHESLPSRPKWWQSRDHKLLHVHKWGLCGGFPFDVKCFKIERECDLNLLLWLYYNGLLQCRCSATLCSEWFMMKFMGMLWLQSILSSMIPAQRIMHLLMSLVV